MKRLFYSLALVSVLLLASCAKKEAGTASNGPHATVVMRDGSKLSGSVVESSAAAITIAGEDKVTHTIPMSQVKQIDYGNESAQAQEPAPAPEQASNPEPVAAPAAAQTPARPGARPQAAASSQPAARPEQARGETARPAEPAAVGRTYTALAGAEVSVRTDEAIDSATAAEGQTFSTSVTQAVRDAEGNVVIPRGARARAVIRSATKGGKIRGASDLVLDLQSVEIGGARYEVSTADLEQRGKSGVGANKRTGQFAAGGAALGAIVGAIAGGGKGAAIGAGSGAGAGVLTQVLTKGSAIKVPAESVLTFKLDRPLRVTAQ